MEKYSIKKSDLTTLILIISVPFLLLFLIQHFGEFKYTGMGGVSIDDAVVDNLKFTTPFGSEINDYVRSRNYKYKEVSSVPYVVKIYVPYSHKLYYYGQGFMKDLIYPLILMILLLGIFIFRKLFKVV